MSSHMKLTFFRARYCINCYIMMPENGKQKNYFWLAIHVPESRPSLLFLIFPSPVCQICVLKLKKSLREFRCDSPFLIEWPHVYFICSQKAYMFFLTTFNRQSTSTRWPTRLHLKRLNVRILSEINRLCFVTVRPYRLLFEITTRVKV
jgi:hypothetical protein